MPQIDHRDFVPDHIVRVIGDHFPERDEETLATQLRECLKFMILASGSRTGTFIPLTRDVDEVWHELILQTEFYFDLCRTKLPGGKYLHHRSIGLADYTRQRDAARVAREFVSWIPAYVGRFGDFDETTARYWTMCHYLRNELGMSLDDVNSVGVARRARGTP